MLCSVYGCCRAMTLCISAAYAVRRCPSVCLSVTFVSSVETNTRIFTIVSLSHSHIVVLVFDTKRYGNSPTASPELQGQKSRFSTIIRLWHRLLQDRRLTSIFRRWSTGYTYTSSVSRDQQT